MNTRVRRALYALILISISTMLIGQIGQIGQIGLAADKTAAASTAPAAPAGDPAAEAAFAQVVRSVWTRDPFPSAEVIAAARKTLEAAAAREPANVRWAYALAHVTRLEAETATGKPAEAKRKDAKKAFEAVVARDPKVADYQFWYGDVCFDMIDDVGFLSKASLASTGKKAFEKAIELDPNHVASQYALGVFFNKAPGIAGGSTAKAKAQGATLLNLPGGRGEYWGHLLLAQIAISGKDWAEMSRQLTAAETAGGEGASPIAAFQTHIVNLLNAANDPAAALPVIARYRAIAKPDDNSPDYFDGAAHSKMGQCEPAVVAFEKVLAKTAEARNTRYELAACYEKLGNRAEAKKHYDEFARRFPNDARAAKAKEASKRLS